MFLLRLPHQGDSNENTQYTILIIKKSSNVILNLQPGDIFSEVVKNEFETVVVNVLSVFEPLKIYCI